MACATLGRAASADTPVVMSAFCKALLAGVLGTLLRKLLSISGVMAPRCAKLGSAAADKQRVRAARERNDRTYCVVFRLLGLEALEELEKLEELEELEELEKLEKPETDWSNV